MASHTASTITLPAIRRSPATLQYKIPSTRPSKFYETRFVLERDDRAKTVNAEWFRKTDPMMPAYPYGKDIRYPEANDGLYGGMSIQSGNKISKGRNEGKTLRKWYPNVRLERIRSDALNKQLTIPIAARVMRTIKKVGGLDQYVTGTKPARIKELGLLGWKLRWMVLNSNKWKSQYKKERAALGLPTTQAENGPLDETFEEAWADAERRNDLIQKQTQKWEALRKKDERFEKHNLQSIISDRSGRKLPKLSTLSLYDPESLSLQDAEVKEESNARHNDPAANVC